MLMLLITDGKLRLQRNLRLSLPSKSLALEEHFNEFLFILQQEDPYLGTMLVTGIEIQGDICLSRFK